MSETVFDCEVCLNRFDQGDRLPKVLACGHTYCLSCLLNVAKMDSCCPVCRIHFSTYPLELETNYQITAWLGAHHLTERSKSTADAKKLFVARIPHEANEFDIQALFAQFGEVKEAIIIRALSATGQNKKFGFVTFSTEVSAKNALRSKPIFLEMEHGPSQLLVEAAWPKRNFSVQPTQQVDSWVAPGYPYSHRIYVDRLPRRLTQSELNEVFSTYGAVESVVLRSRQSQGGRRHYAFVTFVTSDAVNRACRDKAVVLPTGQRLPFRRLRECSPRDGRDGRRHAGRAPRSPPRRVIMTQPDNCCALQ